MVAAFQVPLAGWTGCSTRTASPRWWRRAAGVGVPEDRSAQARHGAGHPHRVQALRAEARAAPAGRWSDAGSLVVAVANPFDRELFENLHRLAGQPIEPVLSAKSDILKAIADIYGFKRTLAQAATDFAPRRARRSRTSSSWSRSPARDKELDASDKPIVQAVDYLLRYAFDNRASDIHIEPKRDASVVRLRIDGVLHPVYTLPARGPPAHRLAGEDALADGHLGEAPAAGRADQDRARRPRGGAPRLDPAHRLRREGGHPHLRPRDAGAGHRRAGLRRRTRSTSSSRGSTSRTASSWSPGPPAAARPPRSTRRSRRWPVRTSTSPPSRIRSRWCGTPSTRCRCSRRSSSTSPTRSATSSARTRTSSWWARSATRRRRRTPSRPRSPATWCSPRCTPTTPWGR